MMTKQELSLEVNMRKCDPVTLLPAFACHVLMQVEQKQ